MRIDSQRHQAGKRVDRTTKTIVAVQRVYGEHNVPDRLWDVQTVHRPKYEITHPIQS